MKLLNIKSHELGNIVKLQCMQFSTSLTAPNLEPKILENFLDYLLLFGIGGGPSGIIAL